MRATTVTTSADPVVDPDRPRERAASKPALSQAGPPASARSRRPRRRCSRRTGPRTQPCGFAVSASLPGVGQPATHDLARPPTGRRSSSSRRMPGPHRLRAARPGVESTRRADGVALVDQRRVAHHDLAAAAALERPGQRCPRSSRCSPARSTASAAAATPRVARRPAGRAAAPPGPCPRPACASPSSTRKVIRRCVGHPGSGRSRRAARPRPRSAVQLAGQRVDAAAPSSGEMARQDGRRESGAGTKLRRSGLGSDRISAVTSSSRSPGICQSKPVGRDLVRAPAAGCGRSRRRRPRPARTGRSPAARASPWRQESG